MPRILPWLSQQYLRFFKAIKGFDGLPLLALRLYLAPVFITAGYKKLASFTDTAAWFGNPEWGLGLPFPEVMAALAGGAEFFGGIALAVGLAVRLFSIPLMVTMLVAMSLHWSNGWQAVADPHFVGGGTERVQGAAKRLSRAKDILREHGNYDWLTEKGKVVILNGGIEFSVTYLIMLLVLFFHGAGRFLSLDWLLLWWQGRRSGVQNLN